MENGVEEQQVQVLTQGVQKINVNGTSGRRIFWQSF